MKKYIKIEEFKINSINKTNTKLILFLFLFLLFTTIIFFSLFTIFNWCKDNSKIDKINKKINNTVTLEKKTNLGILVNPDNNKNSDYWYYVKFPFYEINFSILLAKNNDTVAYIYMKNTNINYPVVQANDNSYYLSYTFDKTKNNGGWIFMDYRNNINNLSDNTIIYGHGRLDKKLFGSLENTLQNSFQKNKDNYVIWLSTLKENMLFQIFSIYTIKSESYYIMTDFASNESKRKWLKTMKERNTAPIDTSVNEKDKILTLSTCQNNQDGRIVVHAKLIKKEKNNNN